MNIIHDARCANKKKAKLLKWAVACEVVGIATVSVAVIAILIYG